MRLALIASMVALPKELFELGSDLQPLIVRGDPNGLAFDTQSDALYVADGHGGAILRIEGHRQHRVGSVSSGGVIGTNRVGGIAVTPSGTIYASRLGYGRAGAIFRIEPDGECEALANLPPHLWRLGLAYDPYNHVLYSAQFAKNEQGPCNGEIVAIDLDSGIVETIIGGLGKPVGVVKVGTTLIVSDAKQRAVYAYDRRLNRRTFIDGLRPDSICACGTDSILVTFFDRARRHGEFRRCWFDGRTRTIGAGDWEPRGIATDGERVFIAARRSGRVLVFRL